MGRFDTESGKVFQLQRIGIIGHKLRDKKRNEI
jgi:hypothetical protein